MVAAMSNSFCWCESVVVSELGDMDGFVESFVGQLHGLLHGARRELVHLGAVGFGEFGLTLGARISQLLLQFFDLLFEG